MGEYDLDRVRFPRRITESVQAQVPVVGKRTQTSSLNGDAATLSPTPGGNGLYASPGDIWNAEKLLPPAVVKTGIPLADRGLGCMPIRGTPINGPCFLDPAQRHFVLSTHQHHVLLAKANYVDAVNGLQIEELLRKVSDDANLALELFLDVITLAVGAAVRTALRRLIGGADDIVGAVTDQQRVMSELSTVTETGIVALLNGAATTARRKVSEHADATRAQAERRPALSFLQQLKAEASAWYDYAGLSSPAGASDAQLLVMFEHSSLITDTRWRTTAGTCGRDSSASSRAASPRWESGPTATIYASSPGQEALARTATGRSRRRRSGSTHLSGAASRYTGAAMLRFRARCQWD